MVARGSLVGVQLLRESEKFSKLGVKSERHGSALDVAKRCLHGRNLDVELKMNQFSGWGRNKQECKQMSAHMLKQKTIGPGCKSTDCPQTSCFAASLACPGRSSLREYLQMLQENKHGQPQSRFSDLGRLRSALGPFWRMPPGSSSSTPLFRTSLFFIHISSYSSPLSSPPAL